jgi:CrcB protein
VTKLLIIAAGGGVGSVLRYLLAGAAQRLTGSVLPIGTMTVNVVGCLAIGLVAAYFAGPQLVRAEWRLGLMVGLLGGFTTFSSFSFETVALLNDGQMRAAVLNVVLSNVLCLAAAWLGYRVGQAWFGV